MRHRFFDIAFTPAVQAEQARLGSRAAYAAAAAEAGEGADEAAGEEAGEGTGDALSEREAAFVAARDSLYLATVSETGWPYVQHRGGPQGFVRPLDARTLAWAEFAGKRQYVSMGNAAANDRVSLLFMDYPNRRRLKVLGRLRTVAPGERPDLAERLAVPGARARIERLVLVDVDAFDWNCPQHITPRFTAAEIEALTAPLHARIAALEARIAAAAEPGPGPSRGD